VETRRSQWSLSLSVQARGPDSRGYAVRHVEERSRVAAMLLGGDQDDGTRDLLHAI
jgi:hypothetical protein